MFANLSTHAVHTLHALGVPTSLIHEFNATQINASFLLLQSSYSSTRCIPCGMRSYVARSLHLPHPDSASDILYIWRAQEYKPGCAAFFSEKSLGAYFSTFWQKSLLKTNRQTKERELWANYR